MPDYSIIQTLCDALHATLPELMDGEDAAEDSVRVYDDEQILDLLRRGMNRSRVAQELFISEGTLYYRLRRLCKLAGAKSVAGLNSLLKKYM